MRNISTERIPHQIPEKYSFDQAASIPLGLATVITGVWNHDPNAAAIDYPAPWEEGGLSVVKGKPTLIIGGSSSVGQYGKLPVIRIPVWVVLTNDFHACTLP